MKSEYSLEKLERVREFGRIKAKYQRKDYVGANEDLTLFTLKYPDDDFGWYYYGKILFQEGKFDEALDVFMEHNVEYNLMMKVDVIKCYLELLRYNDAYLLICELKDIVENEFTKQFLRRAEIVCLKAMNDLKRLSFNDLGYIESQMINYDRDDAINYSISLENKKHLFAREISITKTFREAEKVIFDVANLTNTATLTETYLLRIPGVGYSSGRKLDVLKVSTVYRTHDILSVYPVTSIKDYPKELISNQEEIKTKILRK